MSRQNSESSALTQEGQESSSKWGANQWMMFAAASIGVGLSALAGVIVFGQRVDKQRGKKTLGSINFDGHAEVVSGWLEVVWDHQISCNNLEASAFYERFTQDDQEVVKFACNQVKTVKINGETYNNTADTYICGGSKDVPEYVRKTLAVHSYLKKYNNPNDIGPRFDCDHGKVKSDDAAGLAITTTATAIATVGAIASICKAKRLGSQNEEANYQAPYQSLA